MENITIKKIKRGFIQFNKLLTLVRASMIIPGNSAEANFRFVVIVLNMHILAENLNRRQKHLNHIMIRGWLRTFPNQYTNSVFQTTIYRTPRGYVEINFEFTMEL